MNDSVELNTFIFRFKFYYTRSQNAENPEAAQLTMIQQKNARQKYNAVSRPTPRVQLQSLQHVLAKNVRSF